MSETPAVFVADASAVLPWCFRDEATPTSDLLRAKASKSILSVPAHWHFEVANTLAMAERRGRLTSSDTAEFLAALDAFPTEIDRESGRLAFRETISLARRYSLTVYDAAYLELAVRRRLPLASLDEELRRSAVACGVHLIQAR